VRLHRRVLGGGRTERLFDDHVGVGEAALDVAVPDPEAVADVGPLDRAHLHRGERVVRARRGVVHQRGALRDRGDRIEHRRQLAVGDLDPGGVLPRERGGRGGDRGDDVADEARALGEHPLVADLEAVGPELGDVGWHQRDTPGVNVGGVDGLDQGVGIGRADEGRVQHAVDGDILRVAGGAGDQRIAHAASSSSARRTSTSAARRR
jgi:hypothetical protein